MATYLVLNCLFILAVGCLLRIKPRKPSKTWVLLFIVLICMTALFDSLIIAAGIVGYDANKLLGVYIAEAPIEDFFYAILAAIIIPALWKMNETSRA